MFIGHGNPMNAIELNEFSSSWNNLSKEIPHPTAILCISAHWLTKGTFVTAMSSPRTIHDFGGFPQALFDVKYPAIGDPQLAKETQSLIKNTSVSLDQEWGLDHGCWSVLKQMYPKANIPVIQLSIDYNRPAQYHYNLAKEIASLRKKGVLILGSGNMVHNLRMVGAPEGKSFSSEAMNTEFGFDWALEMNELFMKHIAEGNHQALIDYEKLGSAAKLAVPTPDHYYPLLYTLALQDDQDIPTFFNEKCVAGSLSMTSVLLQ